MDCSLGQEMEQKRREDFEKKQAEDSLREERLMQQMAQRPAEKTRRPKVR